MYIIMFVSNDSSEIAISHRPDRRADKELQEQQQKQFIINYTI